MKNTVHGIVLMAMMLLFSCQAKETAVITVKGKIPSSEMGKTLHHEHILVDFAGAAQTGYHRWNKDSVIDRVLPYLLEIKQQGYKTLVECTPAYVGRDPQLLKLLSERSGMQIMTNTGYYSAAGAKFIPEHGFTETAEQLARRWIDEAQNGIEGTGIYPGFIKIAVEQRPLEALQRKIVKAACLTHKATGLTIMSHTGTAVPAFEQLEILRVSGVHPSAFIWTHAQNEPDFENHYKAARMGAWIAFDNFHRDRLQRTVEFLQQMKKRGLLDKVLLSHDAGWYSPGEPGGGNFRGYTDIGHLLVPALREAGFSPSEIDQLLEENPARAFGVRKRLLN